MWTAMGFRWGLMQVLGQEAFQFGFKDLTRLQEVDGSLEAGCMVLKHFGDNAIAKWFGAERRGLTKRAMLLLPYMKEFVENKPCVNS